ncbi:MAG TPA: DUF721 domain-containing protein [Bryobacteraceae bacterium]|nr:DUF721 domain-containing protein [Bryobacteraceae bacterium]
MMERAGRVLGKSPNAGHGISEEELARSAWLLAVGKRIAARTGHISLVRARLVVEVEDAIWQRQLFTLRGQILAKLEQAIGRPLVTELEFRIAVPRRAPQREASHSRTADEADEIVNPVLRNLYKASRKRAIA